METLSLHRCFKGTLGYYRHDSHETNCNMRFTVFTPPQAQGKACPALFFLSGLTCTEENFTMKAGAYRIAAELGLFIIVPDTSPRGPDVPSDPSGTIGYGAGFYMDATQPPWNRHYRMESYITIELRELVLNSFSIDAGKLGVFGHSMGGHGALSFYLRHPNIYKSASAFAPVCSAIKSPNGRKALAAYFGTNEEDWKALDATEQMRSVRGRANYPPILIDQGTEDTLLETNLHPSGFESACKSAGQKLLLRMQEGYDHGYFFIQTFVEEHLRHHAKYL